MNMETGGFGGDDRRRFLVPALIVAAALVVLLLILGIGAIIRSRTGASPTATVLATRSPTRPAIVGTTAPGTRTVAPSSSAAPATSPRPSTAPSTAPSAAPTQATYAIANTGGDNVNLRATASTTGEVLARLAEGDEVVETGPPVTADGREWRKVRTREGVEGFVASEFTQRK